MNNELEQKSIQHFLGFYINSVKKNDPTTTHTTDSMCQIAYSKRIPLQAPTVQET